MAHRRAALLGGCSRLGVSAVEFHPASPLVLETLRALSAAARGAQRSAQYHTTRAGAPPIQANGGSDDASSAPSGSIASASPARHGALREASGLALAAAGEAPGRARLRASSRQVQWASGTSAHTTHASAPLAQAGLRPREAPFWLRELQSARGAAGFAAAVSLRPPHQHRGGMAGFHDSSPIQEPSTRPRMPATEAEAEPNAATCDKAVERYDEVTAKWRNIRYPSSIMTFDRRVALVQRQVANAVATLREFVMGLPAALGRLAATSPAEWAKWWNHTWAHIKEGAAHYWAGTKLLGVEIRIASRLSLKAARGEELTRRERRQLTRTSADVFRMVPLAVFLLVPFLEFLLPVALKLFPNMLPSTFEEPLKAEEEMKRRLAVKLEVAKFLTETLEEMAKDLKTNRDGEMAASAAALYDFMGSIRAGHPVDGAQLQQFAGLVNDELTLDSLERVHLQSISTLLGIAPFGTDGFLRARLRAHLRRLKDDDMTIRYEGVESLSEAELRSALRDRGMRPLFGGPPAVRMMRAQLDDWLGLSLDRALPSSLLLLSRAMRYTADDSLGDESEGLRAALSGLPDEVLEDVEMETCIDTRASPKKKLEYIKREEELIAEEQEALADLRALELEKKPHADNQQAARVAAVAAAVAQSIVSEARTRQVAAAADKLARDSKGEVELAADSEAKDVSEEERVALTMRKRKQKMGQVVRALAALASVSGVANERASFLNLVEKQIGAMDQRMAESHGTAGMLFTAEGLTTVRPERESPLSETERYADALSRRVGGFLKRIEGEIDDVEGKIGDRMHVIDLDGDGVISMEELTTALTFLKANLVSEDWEMVQEMVKTVGPEGINIKALVQEYECDDE